MAEKAEAESLEQEQEQGKEPGGAEPGQEGAETQEQEGEGQGQAPVKEPEKAKQTPWFTRRIDELTRKRHELTEKLSQTETEKALLQLQLDQLRGQEGEAKPAGQGQVQAPNPDMVPRSEARKMAQEEAKQLAAAEEFNKACNATYEQGTKEFGDFKERVGALFQALGDGQALPVPFVQAALDSGEAHKVLHALGGDLDEASRIMSLSPTKMASELTKLALKLAAPKEASKAPPPLKPVNGRVVPQKDPEKMTTEEWMAWRQNDVESRRKNGEFIQ